ncbi:histidine phosphatase family protein [Sphingomonas gilva]|uniref:histidine phosphatase family protein n=1 Tax=Sphingomonas gilva TaxID=2305907 RepID=UPI001FE535F4|nr:histidine phosphatase family protein [Sphingomonas gilva]
MTATILLIRHAPHAHLGTVLSGRAPGLALSEDGRAQAVRLGRSLAGEALHLVQTSPVQRARETAAIIAAAAGTRCAQADALDEIDFGAWSGRAFADLAQDAAWREWNERRSTAAAPGGEAMAAAQARAVAHIEDVSRAHPERTVAMVTHCDIIRAVVAHILGLSLDAIHRFDVAAASISRIVAGSWGARVQSLNERVA